MSKNVKTLKMLKMYRMTGQCHKWFYRSKYTYTREFDVIPAKGAPYHPSIMQYTRVRVKPDILKNSK
jgi:hypothetical protein